MPDEPAMACGSAAPGLEHVGDLQVELAEHVPLGTRPDGTHWFIPIVGGTVTGPRLSGRVLPGGGDWAIERPDGMWELDARYGLVLDDGTPVEVHNRGYWVGDPSGTARYYQTTPWLRPAGTAPAWEWLRRTVFVGQARELDPLHIVIALYAVVDARDPGGPGGPGVPGVTSRSGSA